jgi:DNA polymerase-3 subunit gamma/tau
LSYKVLARTYRPQRFEALVGQEVVGRTLANAITRQRVHHAYLFCGPRGVGKTSAARILAMALNCEQWPSADPCGTCSACVSVAAGNALDVQEIDGASHNGVDDVRQLQETAYTRPSLRCRIFIIDEVHMLTNQAFNALLKLLEEPPPSVHFIFATTEPHKVLDTIKSRCQRHDFRRIPTRRIVDQLKAVCEAEALQVDLEAMRIIAVAAEGGMRDALSLLEQVIAYTADGVTGALAAECLGLVDRRAVLALLSALSSQDAAAALAQLDDLYSAGSDLRRFADALVNEVRAFVVCAEVGEPGKLLDLDPEALVEMQQMVASMDALHLRRWLRITLDAASEISRSGHPRTLLELAILRMADAASAQSLNQLLNHLQGGSPSAPSRPPVATNRRSAPKPVVTPAPQRPTEKANRPVAPVPQRSAPKPNGPAPAKALGLRSVESLEPRPEAHVEPMPSAPFLHAVAAASQPLAATLALAGLRLNDGVLRGRMDDARMSILRQDRSKKDIAAALSQSGLLALIVADLRIDAERQSPQPANSPPVQNAEPLAPAPVPLPVEEPVKLPAQPKPMRAKPALRQLNPPLAQAQNLPPLDSEAIRLMTLWMNLYPRLPDVLKGRLVPFAPLRQEGDKMVLGCESEGLIEALSGDLGKLVFEGAEITNLSLQQPSVEQLPMLRAMLRQMRADRDPVFREKIALRGHETTQAVMSLFNATVDELGL